MRIYQATAPMTIRVEAPNETEAQRKIETAFGIMRTRALQEVFIGAQTSIALPVETAQEGVAAARAILDQI